MKTWLPLCFILVCYYCIFNAESKRKSQGKLSYEVNYAGGIQICDDVEQDLFDLSNLYIESDSATGTVLGGSFDFNKNIVNGTEVFIYVNKNSDQGVILVTVLKIENLCDHVSDEDRPWTAVFDAMELDPRECPLPIKTYELPSIKMNLSSMDALLTRENVGEYNLRIELELNEGDDDSSKGGNAGQGGNVIGCFTLGLTIDEIREKD